jgi:hypothetical protein
MDMKIIEVSILFVTILNATSLFNCSPNLEVEMKKKKNYSAVIENYLKENILQPFERWSFKIPKV